MSDEEHRRCLRSLNFANARHGTENVGEAFGETHDWIFDLSSAFRLGSKEKISEPNTGLSASQAQANQP